MRTPGQITPKDIRHAVEHSNGNKIAAAAILSIGRETVYAKLMEQQ